jgi:4-amino-4-deoxy-L-arabinose transferase-like glycosyltransferase
VAPLHLASSRQLVSDAPVTFAVTLSFWLIGRDLERATPTRMWASALSVGLATSVKYTAAAMVVPLLAAVWIRSGRVAAAVRLRRLAGATLGVGAGFFLGTPFALLDLATLFAQLHSLGFWHMRHGHHVTAEANGFAVYLFDALPRGLGPVATVLGLLGTALLAVEAVRRQRVGPALPILFVVPFGAVIGASKIPFDRYALPLLPVLCVAAAVVAERVVGRISRGGGRALAAGGVAAAVLLVPALASVGVVLDLGKADTRDVAARWIASRVGPGTALATELYGPWLPPAPEQLRSRIARLEEAGDGGAEARRQLARWRRKHDALARSAPPAPAYVVYTLVLHSSVPDAAEVPYSLSRLRALGVREVVLTSEMWERFARFPEWYREPLRFHEELRQSGRLVLELEAMDAPCAARLARLRALGLGDSWCRRQRGPSLRIVELP